MIHTLAEFVASGLCVFFGAFSINYGIEQYQTNQANRQTYIVVGIFVGLCAFAIGGIVL